MIGYLLLGACKTTPKETIEVSENVPEDSENPNEETSLSTGEPSTEEPNTEEPSTEVDVEEPTDTSNTDGSTPNESYICYSENPVEDELLPSLQPNGLVETHIEDGFTDDYLYDPTNYIKIGIRREWGGSIVFFGLGDGNSGMNDTNTIDANDTGREVQVALYDPDRVRQGCAHDASCQTSIGECPNSIQYLGWNPVQGGNRCNNGSTLSSYDYSNGELQIQVQPLHWNPNWDFADCTSSGCDDPLLSQNQSDVLMTQNIRFVDTHIVELRYDIQELAGLDHANNLQELPTVYSGNGNNSPDLWRLMDPNGNQIEIDIPANDGFFYKNFTSTAPWVTLQNDNLTYGVGILYENGLLEYQGWQNRDMPFNNVRSLIQFPIPAYSQIHARAYLMLGSFDTINGLATNLLNILPPFGSLDTPAHNGSTTEGQLEIAGWALDNRGVASVQAVIDESYTYPLTYGSSRPDVCIAWPSYPNCSNVGFEGSADISMLESSSDCAHQIEIIATDADGNVRTIARNLFYIP